jgi:hypothetical protein
MSTNPTLKCSRSSALIPNNDALALHIAPVVGFVEKKWTIGVTHVLDQKHGELGADKSPISYPIFKYTRNPVAQCRRRLYAGRGRTQFGFFE